MKNTPKEQFALYAASRIRSVRDYPLTERKLSVYSDVLQACKDVYNSRIIFPQGGAAAKRKETPGIDVILSALARRVYDYLSCESNAEMTQARFNQFHDELCTSFLESLNAARRSVGYVDICYGSAQKMVNILFKYHACYNDFPSYAGHFKHCHMPVDTVILKWLKDNYDVPRVKYSTYISKRSKKNKETISASYKNTAWTKFDRGLYTELMSIIRDRVSHDERFEGQSMLDAEFSIWSY